MKKIIILCCILIFSNANSSEKDLSGNALDCYINTNISDYTVDTHVSILFETKKKAKFAISSFKIVDGEIDEFDILKTGEIVNYKVHDWKIVLKVKGIKSFYWDRKEVEGEIWIKRENLELMNLMFFYDFIKCKLVDANDTQLFDKYNEFQSINNELLQKQKKESESKNIL
tara:strand:+ start:281 stop:793 length:513 start_codon:yes stop_codon:yes gene_type:complete